MTETTNQFDQWALLEIMGHKRFAGRVSEQSIGGSSFIRIDVPEVDGREAYTKIFGASTIYCITPVTERVARGLAAKMRGEPIKAWDLPEELRERVNRPAIAHAACDVDDDEYYEDLDE